MHLCKRNGVADLLNHAPQYNVRYHAEYCRSELKDVGINAGELQKVGSAGTPLFWDRMCNNNNNNNNTTIISMAP